MIITLVYVVSMLIMANVFYNTTLYDEWKMKKENHFCIPMLLSPFLLLLSPFYAIFKFLQHKIKNSKKKEIKEYRKILKQYKEDLLKTNKFSLYTVRIYVQRKIESKENIDRIWLRYTNECYIPLSWMKRRIYYYDTTKRMDKN